MEDIKRIIVPEFEKPKKTYKKDSKYSYDRFNSSGNRVGQAVYDILSKPQDTFTVEDILDQYQHEYVKEFEDCVHENYDRYESPFYVVVLTQKEFWAENVMRNWFIARQTAPTSKDMVSQYPHHNKTLYKIDKKGDVTLEWTVPGLEDMKSILKKPDLYDRDLVKYCANAVGIEV